MENIMNESEVSAILHSIPERVQSIRCELGKRIYGQDELILMLLAGIFAGGHCLLTGVPGLAKTLLASSIAEIADLEFKRVQFTPDMMPSDITGNEILEIDKISGERIFKFVKGPIFTQLLLADEINRTTPKTQSALLEGMQERSVTIAGVTRPLARPFFVLATQNPIEQEGTYPLPEAQLDRFMFGLEIGYPSCEDELKIMLNTTGVSLPPLEKVITAEELLQMQEAIRLIPIPESVAQFATRVVRATRPAKEDPSSTASKYIRWGAGPRAGQCLALAGKAFAAFDGRFNVAKEDILKALEPVMRHRVILNYRAESEHRSIRDLLDELIWSAS